MDNKAIAYFPIGIIHSEHTNAKETPIQPHYAAGAKGVVEVWGEFAEGLRDIEGFSHIYLIYHLHLAGEVELLTKPFLQDVEHGVFSTRSPRRPNGIGISVVEMVSRRENFLDVVNVDILDGTPLLDIKPYITKFDAWIKNTRSGWQEEISDEQAAILGARGYKK